MKWWRRRESKPSIARHEPARDVANRREGDRSLATVRDDSRRRIAKPMTPRAALLAVLADYVKLLALAGDIEAARVASDAIGRLLGSNETSASVVDFAGARRRCGE